MDLGGFTVEERDKEENHEAKRNHHHHNHKETHGLRDDIDEETPITDVKAPNVFQRAKEEIEAIVEAIHSKKEREVESHQDSFFHGDKNRFVLFLFCFFIYFFFFFWINVKFD